MNAQLPITTTPKYNFSPLEDNLQSPQQFIELSIRSLKKTKHLQPPFIKNATTQFSTTEYYRRSFPAAKLIKIKPDPTKTPIIGIDVSSIKLGDTKRGILLAVRGAIVWRQTNSYRYLRIGPFPFHVTEKNKNEICSFRQHHIQENTLPNILYMQTRLMTLLERWIQTTVNQTSHNSLVLWDGSLTAGTTETSTRAMEQMLKEAHNNQNTILAFSKITQLLLHGYRITDLVSNHFSPCLLRIQNYPRYEGPMCLMGNIYVAKLTEGSCAFRLDIDKRLSHKQSIEAVQKLLGNDMILQGYPETLRLAHIFSTFTANEVLGIQRWVINENDVKIITRPNVRRILFGRFGKGPEG